MNKLKWIYLYYIFDNIQYNVTNQNKYQSDTVNNQNSNWTFNKKLKRNWSQCNEHACQELKRVTSFIPSRKVVLTGMKTKPKSKKEKMT
jgi:hypothetical protein